jgi:hypothetical protein
MNILLSIQNPAQEESTLDFTVRSKAISIRQLENLIKTKDPSSGDFLVRRRSFAVV